jgi:diguanylate cyclase (GGDEF)-like protein
MKSRLARWALTVCAGAAVYVGVAQIGFALDLVNGAVSTVWVPTGLSLAILFLGGRNLWPALVLGEFAANVLHGSGAGISLAFGVGDALEALVGVEVLRRLHFDARMERVRDVFTLLLPGAFVATLVGATIGTGTLLVGAGAPWSSAWLTWHTWWLGDATGVIIATPLIFTFLRGGLKLPHGRHELELVAFVVALVPLAWVAGGHAPEVALVSLPVLFWGAMRFGQRGAAVANTIVAGAGVALVDHGSTLTGIPLINRLLLAQDFLLVAAVTTLVLAAVLSERDRRTAEVLALNIELMELNQQLATRASTDALTGLANHRAFYERLDQELANCWRYDRTLAVAMIDIDNFKAVNDTRGHMAGDSLLTAVSAEIGRVMRAGALVARIGGDEFAVILPDSDCTAGRQAVERAREAVAGLEVEGLKISVSAGLSDSNHAETAKRLMECADTALYEAKAAGRNRSAVFVA